MENQKTPGGIQQTGRSIENSTTDRFGDDEWKNIRKIRHTGHRPKGNFPINIMVALSGSGFSPKNLLSISGWKTTGIGYTLPLKRYSR